MPKGYLFVHTGLDEIRDRILQNAIGALMQANTHAVYQDPGMEHREQMSILNAALAGELFLKAILATEHPLLIFRDLFHLDRSGSTDFDIDEIIRSGRTYAFEHLPKLLWIATGERIADQKLYDEVRSARNSVQHFCSPDSVDLRALSLKFIYGVIDPLVNKHFNMCAIEYHEDFSVSYDYVVQCIIGMELEFSIPENFRVTEVDIEELVSHTSKGYREKFGIRLLSAMSLNKRKMR